MRLSALRQRWQAGGAVVNGWLSIPDSVTTEIMARQGWDSLTIDLQHGLVDYQAMIPMLQAISTTQTTPLVRVPWLEPGILMKVLDAGALGLICPMISTREDAQRFVAYTRYAPRGTRSYGPLRAMLVNGADYPERADEEIVRFAMIETAEALDNLDAILSVEGLDAIYIGPSDLSLALGCRPSLDNVAPPVAQAIEHILARSQFYGLVPGIHTGSSAGALRRVAAGFKFVTAGSDAGFVANGAQAVVSAMKDGLSI